MKLAVFGGTGATGTHLVARALEAGHTVTVLARDPARVLPASHERLTVVRGTATSRDDTARALTGAEAALSALGGSSLRDDSTISGAMAVIVEALRAEGVRRIVAVGSAGIFNEVPGLPGLIVRTILRHPLRDHREQHRILSTSGLDWTLVRAVRLTDGPATGVYRVALEGCPRGGGQISRADLAHYMMRCLTGDEGLNAAPAVAY